MAKPTTARAARLTKPGGRKTANRFAVFSGVDGATASADPSPTAEDSTPDERTGLIGAISAVVAEESHRVVEVRVAEIAPHPFNDPRRSQPQPGDPKWDELLNGVRANGVRLPVLVVPREAFAAARPSVAGDISSDTRYVLVYGHRRRAAALEAGRDTIPAVIDDAIMDDDGDLDAMATENLGREDLSDLAEADLFARYSEIGLSQRAIAERLGVDQATVSRRLALLLLSPALRHAVDVGVLPPTEAAALAGSLPYGPPRRWQKSKDPHQFGDLRLAEQAQALRLILDRGMLAARAAERVIAERNARNKATELGISIVEDPRAELGENCHRYRVAAFDDQADIIAAINPGSGSLDLYTRPSPDPAGQNRMQDPAEPCGTGSPTDTDPATSSGDTEQHPNGADSDDRPGGKRRAKAAAGAAAQARRRQSCALLLTHQPTNAELLKILVGQYLSGVAARSTTSAVSALLDDWDAHVDGAGDKARNTQAWHRAVAAAELHVAELKDGAWDNEARAHVERLTTRVGYEPTSWERHQINTGR